MPEQEPITDPFLIQLLESYTSAEAAEIQQYMEQWDAATYTSVAQSILHQFCMKMHITRPPCIPPLARQRCTHKSEKLHPPKICGEAALLVGFPTPDAPLGETPRLAPLQATAVSAA